MYTAFGAPYCSNVVESDSVVYAQYLNVYNRWLDVLGENVTARRPSLCAGDGAQSRVGKLVWGREGDVVGNVRGDSSVAEVDAGNEGVHDQDMDRSVCEDGRFVGDGDRRAGEVGDEKAYKSDVGIESDGSNAGERQLYSNVDERCDENREHCVDVSTEGLAKGKHYEKNRKKRLRRNAKSARAAVGAMSWRVDAKPLTDSRDTSVDELQTTWKQRRILENKIAVARAQDEMERRDAIRVASAEAAKTLWEKRILENQLSIDKVKQQSRLIGARDVGAMIERDRIGLLRDTEVGRVSIEKAFGELASAGDVPSMVGGSAHTIKSGSISPGSSASEAQYREMHKQFLDIQAKNVELVNVNKRLERVIAGSKLGLSEADIPEIEPSVSYTLDSRGQIARSLDDDAVFGYKGKDGRFHVGECYDDERYAADDLFSPCY